MSSQIRLRLVRKNTDGIMPTGLDALVYGTHSSILVICLHPHSRIRQ